MNEINVEAIKVTMPLITDDELNVIDNNLHSITDDFLKYKIRDKDLYLAQYIMKKLEKENQELKVLNRRYEEVLSDNEENYKIFSSEIKELKAQQKEFIKYLEDGIKVSKNTIESLNDCRIPYSKCKEIILKEILSKYKSIIGNNSDVTR